MVGSEVVRVVVKLYPCVLLRQFVRLCSSESSPCSVASPPRLGVAGATLGGFTLNWYRFGLGLSSRSLLCASLTRNNIIIFSVAIKETFLFNASLRCIHLQQPDNID